VSSSSNGRGCFGVNGHFRTQASGQQIPAERGQDFLVTAANGLLGGVGAEGLQRGRHPALFLNPAVRLVQAPPETG
jgi:hypothetical protein